MLETKKRPPVSMNLRRQILEDVLGDSVEEYENFNREEAETKRQHRQRIPLWQFLLHLLNRDSDEKYIQWSKDYELEFRIRDTIGVAELWGSVKNKTDMTYEKLGRAMRYYYGKSIIEKVPGRRYSYRFILSRRTKKYLSQFINVSQMEIVSAAESDHEVNEDEGVSIAAPLPLNENGNKLKAATTTPRCAVMKKPPPKPVSIAVYSHHKPPFVGQAATKTKIFRPDDLLFNQFVSSNNNNNNNKNAASATTAAMLKRCEKRNSIIYHDTTERRSAFSVPEKLRGLHHQRLNREEYTSSSLLHALQMLPVETDTLISSTPSPLSPMATTYRKRGYPFTSATAKRCENETIAYCCCGSHNCKIKYIDYASEDSEGGESHFSHESTSPPVEKSAKPFLLSPRSNHHIHKDGAESSVDYLHEECLIRRELKGLKDYRDHEQSPIFILKSNGGTKFDPFMGYKDSAPIVEDLFNVTGYQC